MTIAHRKAPAISIIVPVYNMERYLGTCLDALCKQTFEDIEIICVNDGSTDLSGSILARYAARDGRIVVINKPNSGYGASMNCGLDEARGTYVGIVEPDDYPDRVMFQKLYEAASEHDCDLVKCNYYRMYADHEEPEWNLHGYGYGRPFDPADKPQIICTVPSIWAALYRRSMLERAQIRFRETPGASFQDTGFTLKAWFAAKRCVLVRRPLLHYRMDNPGSSSKTTDKAYVVCDELAEAESFMRSMPVRAGAFSPWFHVGKWGKYRWNYERIAPELHEEFAQRMRGEFESARESGELLLELFGDNSRCQVRYLLDSGVESFVARYPESYPYDWEPDVHATSVPFELEVPDGPSPAVTVMIAAHNSEDYIVDCLDSLKAQTFGDFEAIIVDDASEDGTCRVARACIGGDDRFSLVECKVNGGPGAARNKALDRARGEYVMYVDSDDMLVSTALAKLVARARIQNLDELLFSAHSFYDGASIATVLNEDFSDRVSYDGVGDGKVLFTFCSDRGQHYSQGALRMVRRELLESEGIRFPEGIIHEDVLYSFRILVASKRSSLLNEPLYLRRQRMGSIMGSSRRTAANVEGHLVAIRGVRRWVREHFNELDEGFLEAIARELGHWSHLVAHDWLDELTEDEREEILSSMSSSERKSFKFGILGAGEASERAADEWRESQTYRLGDAVATVPRLAKLNVQAVLGRRKLDEL